MSARGDDAQRRWGAVSSPAVIRPRAERGPVPWTVVLARLRAAAASGELAQRPATEDGRREPMGASARVDRQAAAARRRLLEAIALRARSGCSS